MKEIISKNKWLIVVLGIVVLNIGWMVYQKYQSLDGVLISEQSNSALYEANDDQLKALTDSNEEVTSNDAVSLAVSQSEIEGSRQERVEENCIPSNEPEMVPVYICGEVLNPGVYYVQSNAIINDVIVCSGGLTREANQTVINLASPIQPNEKIIIPRQDEEIDKSTDSYENRERMEEASNTVETYLAVTEEPVSVPKTNNNTSELGLVNINTASKEELMGINGIGEVKAAAIIAYREEKGGFKSIEEITQVSGIGEKTFEKMKQFITT